MIFLLIYMLHRASNAIILTVKFLVIHLTLIFCINKCVMSCIQLVKSVYHLVKLIVIRNTLYLVLMNMWKNFMILLVMTLLCGEVLANLDLEKFCLSMNQSRLRFKSALKYCQQNEIKMRADSLARSMMNNDMTGFWKDVHKITNSEVPLATKVDGCVGDTNIAEMEVPL